MRRSGSSSCLLRPKSAVDLTAVESPPMSVTLINTQQLPTYSTERFYMLSELEIKAHSTLFLCDLNDCDQTQDTVESSLSESGEHFEKHPSFNVPSYAILYVLWRPDQTSSARAFAEGHISAAMKQWNINALVDSHLYLVVDIVAVHNEHYENNENEGARQRRFQVQIHTAETLARYVAQTFRSSLDGITVGVSDHVRAAPGLEACLDAVSVGSRDRRRLSSAEKSLVGLVALHPEDLLGLDSATTDAVQGVLQSRTCAEWNGNGTLQSFAKRAHSAWCVAHQITEEEHPPKKRRTRRRNVLDDGEDLMLFADPIKSFFVIFLLGILLSRLWDVYVDSMSDNVTHVPDEMNTIFKSNDP